MSGFSNREQAVFQALARGAKTEDVARDLCLSPHTVRTYVQTGMRKLGSRTRAHAVAIAIDRGLISSHGEDGALPDAARAA